MSSSSNSGGEGGAAAGLAPGFRFHPTDEELVGYYLKRKIAGRPFRVDAISEIELYKAEPWDLPGKSRIRSRDAEWYFFCALDRKYANRSRTNRATAAGYWKTTGKDRPVCRSSGGAAATSSPIGMKKTLVFHLGRAPSGRRTNWVMHEYRLIEPQDGFVVCRIFQKRGPGPQNGAQYGAPLAEVDDWDECETPVVKEELVDGDLNADLDVEEQKPVLFMGQELSNGVEGSFYGDAGDQWRSNVILKDRFLELDDFAASPRDTIHKQEDLNSVADYLANDEDNGNDDDGDDDDDDNDDGDDDQKHDENGRFKEFSETGQDADDGLVYFDAASQYPDGDHGLSSPGMNSFLDATMGGEVGADLIDEIMAYFDATENLNPTDLDVDAQPSSSSSSSPSSSSHHPCPAPTVNASPQSSADKAGCSSSSPMSLPIAETCHADLHSSESWEKALSKHLFTMLDAISPPPAFVEGQPAKGSQAIQHHSTDRPSSSIRITAGIIQIHGAIVPGNGKNSSLQKNIGISFVFSCTEDSDLMGSGSLPKTAGGFLLRNSFHLLFLSVLLLTASFKIGLHIYSR